MQIDEEKVETVTDFIFLGSKVTVDADCSLEIRRLLFLGREVMTNLDSVLKSRDITLLTEVWILKAMAFPVVMYRCESWGHKESDMTYPLNNNNKEYMLGFSSAICECVFCGAGNMLRQSEIFFLSISFLLNLLYYSHFHVCVKSLFFHTVILW